MIDPATQAILAENIKYGRKTSELPQIKKSFPNVSEILLLLVVGHSGPRVAESIFSMENNLIIENASIVLSISIEDCTQLIETADLLGVDLILETLTRGQFTGVA